MISRAVWLIYWSVNHPPDLPGANKTQAEDDTLDAANENHRQRHFARLRQAVRARHRPVDGRRRRGVFRQLDFAPAHTRRPQARHHGGAIHLVFARPSRPLKPPQHPPVSKQKYSAARPLRRAHPNRAQRKRFCGGHTPRPALGATERARPGHVHNDGDSRRHFAGGHQRASVRQHERRAAAGMCAVDSAHLQAASQHLPATAGGTLGCGHAQLLRRGRQFHRAVRRTPPAAEQLSV